MIFGIPLALFVCGILLITAGSFKYVKSAYYLASVFSGSGKSQTEQGANPDSAYPEYGEKFGLLSIDSAGISCPVFNGDSDEQLRQGAGHYFGSRYPGENGKIVLAAHRNTYFKTLGKAKPGDTVVFKTKYGTFEYIVSDIKITGGNDQSIIEPEDGKEKLVLYTCYPFDYIGNAPERYVVTCIRAGEGK